MLIILEGADGSGKSTLARRIADTLTDAYPGDTVDVWHAGPPDTHPLDAYEKPLYDYRPNTGRHIICDRWHVGEWIYPDVLGRTSDADTAVWRHIDMFMRSRGAVIVHAALPTKQIVANVRKRGDDLIKVRQLQGISAAYFAMMQASHAIKMRYTQLGSPFATTEIIATARFAESQAKVLNPYVTYVGPPRPRYLLLGDVRHQLRHDIENLVDSALTVQHGPAFGPYRGTSGHFLLSHLPYEIVPHLGIANACDVDDPDALWHALGQPQTVALGANAAKRATWAQRRSHPQFVRRFQHHNGREYGLDIMESFK